MTQNTFIKHDGINGMKWGERRFQNPDGTWTEEGLARRRAQYESAKESKFRKAARAVNAVGGASAAIGSSAAATVAALSKNDPGAKERAFTPGKDNKPSNYQKVLNDSSKIMSETKNIDRALSGDRRPQVYTDDLTNEELRYMTERLRLEQEYKNYVNSQNVNSGRDKLKDTLEIIGSVVAIGVDLASIAGSIAAIRNSNKANKAENIAKAAQKAESVKNVITNQIAPSSPAKVTQSVTASPKRDESQNKNKVSASVNKKSSNGKTKMSYNVSIPFWS